MVWSPLIEKLAFSIGGAFVALIVAHFAVGTKLAFIQGQLSQLMAFFNKVETLEKHAVIVDFKLDKHGKDLTSAHEKIRTLHKTR